MHILSVNQQPSFSFKTSSNICRNNPSTCSLFPPPCCLASCTPARSPSWIFERNSSSLFMIAYSSSLNIAAIACLSVKPFSSAKRHAWSTPSEIPARMNGRVASSPGPSSPDSKNLSILLKQDSIFFITKPLTRSFIYSITQRLQRRSDST